MVRRCSKNLVNVQRTKASRKLTDVNWDMSWRRCRSNDMVKNYACSLHWAWLNFKINLVLVSINTKSKPSKCYFLKSFLCLRIDVPRNFELANTQSPTMSRSTIPYSIIWHWVVLWYYKFAKMLQICSIIISGKKLMLVSDTLRTGHLGYKQSIRGIILRNLFHMECVLLLTSGFEIICPEIPEMENATKYSRYFLKPLQWKYNKYSFTDEKTENLWKGW